MKKTFKRLICAVLLTCILVPCMNFTAFAADNSIFVGEVVTVSASDNYGKSFLEFVPEETGAYAFYSTGDLDTCGYIFDGDMNVLCENDDYYDYNFRVVYKMTAGEKYTLFSELYSNDGVGEYSVTIEKLTETEEVVIFHGGETMGYVGRYLYFECIGDSDDSYLGELTWEIGDEDVAVIDYAEGALCDVYFTGVGTTTLTVTSDLGYSDTIDIVSAEASALSLDEPVYISYGTLGGLRMFRFTPSASGSYAFYTDGAIGPELYVYTEENSDIAMGEPLGNEGDIKAIGELTAGETYYIDVSTIFESSDFYLTVTRCVEPEEVSIMAYGNTEAYKGMYLSLEAVFSPELAAREECTWKSSDPDVASIEEFGTECEVFFNEPGLSEITVTTESGLTSSITVECLEMTNIGLNEWKTVNAVEEIVFCFTPAVSGKYSFVSEGELMTQAVMYDSEWWTVSGQNNCPDGKNFSLSAELTAGETYYLACMSVDYVTEGSFRVKVTQSSPIASISFAESTVYGYVGEMLALSVFFNPQTAFPEECTFTIDNENVAEIFYNLDNTCVLSLVGEGTATLSARDESGHTAKCTITVDEMKYTSLTLARPVDVSTEKYDYAYFEFTPEEDGTYSFISTGEFDTYVSLIDEYMDELASDDDTGAAYNFCLTLDMEAGNTYRFVTGYYKGRGADLDSYSVAVVMADYAETISINANDAVLCELDSYMMFEAELLPYGCYFEDIEWFVDDESIAIVAGFSEDLCGVQFVGEGTCTLTVRTSSGLEDHIFLVVGEDSVVEGDASGDGQVNAVDTNLVRRVVAGTDIVINTINADMNGDGQINAVDVNLIRRLIIGE